MRKILTVSESVSTGAREDRSGAALAATLARRGFRIVEQRTVPDGVAPVAAALVELSTSFAGLVVTTGGTGLSPTDLTPEATRTVVERDAPGLAEAMRAANPLGRLSRGVAGTVGKCLVLNVPGSPQGAVESIEAVADVLTHALELLAGEGLTELAHHEFDPRPPVLSTGCGPCQQDKLNGVTHVRLYVSSAMGSLGSVGGATARLGDIEPILPLKIGRLRKNIEAHFHRKVS